MQRCLMRLSLIWLNLIWLSLIWLRRTGPCLPFNRQQGSSMCASLLVLTGVRIRERQKVGILVVAQLELRSPLQISQGFKRFSVVNQEFSHTVIGLEASRFVLHRPAQGRFSRINGLIRR